MLFSFFATLGPNLGFQHCLKSCKIASWVLEGLYFRSEATHPTHSLTKNSLGNDTGAFNDVWGYLEDVWSVC